MSDDIRLLAGASAEAVMAIGHHAANAYVSTPTVEVLGTTVQHRIVVARLRFRDGGHRLVISDWYGNVSDDLLADGLAEHGTDTDLVDVVFEGIGREGIA